MNEEFLPGDLFWGENDPKSQVVGDLQPGEEKVRLNHLVGRCEIFDRVPEANASRFLSCFCAFCYSDGRDSATYMWVSIFQRVVIVRSNLRYRDWL